MNTTIVLPEILLEKVQKTANELGLEQNDFFVQAVEEYISKHNNTKITDKYNTIYENLIDDKQTSQNDLGVYAIREFTKDDTW